MFEIYYFMYTNEVLFDCKQWTVKECKGCYCCGISIPNLCIIIMS